MKRCIVIICIANDEFKIKTTFKKYLTKNVTFCIELDNHKIFNAGEEKDIVIREKFFLIFLI